jgi:hypothetical protein
MKNIKLFYCLITLACACFLTCSNPIIEKWWVEEEPDVEYVTITKMVPQVTYETIVEHEIVNQVVIQQLPPEIIYQTIIQEVDVEKDVYIYETVIEKVPEIVYQTITQTVEVDVPVYVYETIYDTVYQEVEIIVHDPPTDEQIKEYIKEHIKEVVQLIKDDPDSKEIITNIIQSIPPDELITYLTDEQIKYIIQQQPPQIILETIDIVDIEYIIFAGNATSYNGPHAPGATTDLTAQEKSSNDATIAAMAQSLKDHPDYLMILHGHANPTSSNPSEVEDLMTISKARADAVNVVLKAKFTQLGGDASNWDTRVSAKGYGGEKNLTVTDSTYSGLNRRVEMILVRIGVD